MKTEDVKEGGIFTGKNSGRVAASVSEWRAMSDYRFSILNSRSPVDECVAALVRGSAAAHPD
jgi:hypothetical protein